MAAVSGETFMPLIQIFGTLTLFGDMQTARTIFCHDVQVYKLFSFCKPAKKITLDIKG